jgi:colanic acid biosynthesis glycosyl transferase WcaI
LKVIFLNRYFYPDHSATSQMLSKLAFALAASNCRVTIITSRQLYDRPGENLPRRETIDGVEVHRVWTSSFGRYNLAGRAFDYLTFYLLAARALWRLARRGDVVVAKTDPPMLSVVAAPIVAIRQARLVNWLQDIFPEVAEALGLGGMRLPFLVIRKLRDWSLKRAWMNIAIGTRMAKRLEDLDVPRNRTRIIANWADGKRVHPVEPLLNPLRRKWELDGKFVVGYSGNLGRAHEIATLIEAIASLESQAGTATADTARDGAAGRREIAWLFIGSGALHKKFEAEVRARGLKSVMFQPYQPEEHLAESLSAADVHLVSLRPELEGLIVPSKFYGIAAAGRPAIFIGDEDGEIARILAAEGCGWTVKPGDGAGLAARVQQLADEPLGAKQAGQCARSAFERSFDFPNALAAWEGLLGELGALPGPAIQPAPLDAYAAPEPSRARNA